MLAARLIDRVGKGIRGAPRDALVADIALVDLRGATFGLRQSLNTVGAFLGPLLAMGLMLLWANDFRAVSRNRSGGCARPQVSRTGRRTARTTRS